jgi:hypothetical protein
MRIETKFVSIEAESLEIEQSVERAVRNIAPETPIEMVHRVFRTKFQTPPLPLPRGLGRTIERFDW